MNKLSGSSGVFLARRAPFFYPVLFSNSSRICIILSRLIPLFKKIHQDEFPAFIKINGIDSS